MLQSPKNIEIKIGNALELKDIPPGTLIHNVELIPGNGAKLARFRILSNFIGYDGDYAILKLTSGETRKVSNSCLATIEQFNPDQKYKDRKSRQKQMERKRPQTRGVANPVDHPHEVGKEKHPEQSSFLPGVNLQKV